MSRDDHHRHHDQDNATRRDFPYVEINVCHRNEAQIGTRAAMSLHIFFLKFRRSACVILYYPPSPLIYDGPSRKEQTGCTRGT